ncbi:MAG: hypothetical protein WCF10_21150 [Polyangiales bacterium]
MSLAACAHTVAAKPGSAVVVVAVRPPDCNQVGVVEGVGGSDQRAIDDALERAAARGATHVILGTPELNLNNGMTTFVDATLFDCPPSGAEYPPVGYP